MAFLLFVLGCSIGSFLNVLIDRLPVGEDVIFGRSHCDHCHRQLAWYELIPIVSWCIQRGKSTCCRRHISIQYPLVEAFTGLGFVILFHYFEPLHSTGIPFVGAILLFCAMLALVVADSKTELIPVAFLYTAGIGALLLHSPLVLSCMSGGMDSCTSLVQSFLIPSLIGVGIFFLLWIGSRGRAMGDGDVFLAGIIGFSLGYPMLIIAYYAAFLTGALVGVILILRGKKRLKSHIAFGPFLVLGLGIASLFGNVILSWWSQLW